MTNSSVKFCVSVYLSMVWVTFGLSYNLDYDREIYAANGMRALFCSLGWPLYWSTKIFKPFQPGYYLSKENPEKE